MNYACLGIHQRSGASGKVYPFLVFGLQDALRLKFENFNYVLAKRNLDGSVDDLYTGEAQDHTRFDGHEKIPAARRLGMNEIHICYTGHLGIRLQVETDLIRACRPPLNKQPIAARNTIAGSGGMGSIYGLRQPPTIPPRRVLGFDNPENSGVAGSIFGSLAPNPGVSGSPLFDLLNNRYPKTSARNTILGRLMGDT